MEKQTPGFDPTPDKMSEGISSPIRAEFEGSMERRLAHKRIANTKPAVVALEARPADLRISIGLVLNPADSPPGYVQRDLDRVDLNLPAAVTLKMLTASLAAQGQTLSDGMPIRRPQQAIVWLLEHLSLDLPQRVLDDALSEAAKYG